MKGHVFMWPFNRDTTTVSIAHYIPTSLSHRGSLDYCIVLMASVVAACVKWLSREVPTYRRLSDCSSQLLLLLL